MPKREKSEFNALKKLGFEFEAPQDEFSYQPDSGGTASGKRAKEEGIDVDLDAESRGAEQAEGPYGVKDLVAPIPDELDRSQEQRLAEEDLTETDKNVGTK